MLKGCADFSTQSAANAYLKLTPAAKPMLDSNGNGIACEAKFVEQAPQMTPEPEVRVTANPKTSTTTNASTSRKPACPTDQGPISGNWCMHSANGPDNPGYVSPDSVSRNDPGMAEFCREVPLSAYCQH